MIVDHADNAAPATASPPTSTTSATATASRSTASASLAGPDSADQQTSPDDLAQIITAYNQVTERLQQSHETLQQEVLRLREELASTNAQLQRSKRLSALGEMAAGIAHEIRNPLAAIQLYAGMTLEDLPEQINDQTESNDLGERIDSARDSTEKIASAVRGLTGIVNDVLSFARQIEPNPRLVNVSDVYQRLVNAHRPAIDEAGVQLDIQMNDQPEPTIHADPDLLHQALLNLVRNAVDVMGTDQGASSRESTANASTRAKLAGLQHQRQTRAQTLTLAAWTNHDDSTTLQIRDTGPGIDDEHVDRIFNPFFTTRNTGTGLGLAIVHRIIDAHGGSIHVRNEGGAVFEMTFVNISPTSAPTLTQADLPRHRETQSREVAA